MSQTLVASKERTGENFPVGSILIDRRLRPHVHAFYAFARHADDIADSGSLRQADKLARLAVMDDVLMGRMDAGSDTAVALRASLHATGVTPRHAQDLLAAFRQDATQSRYDSWDALLDYCRLSAMPVGRHVLDLHGEDPATHAPSDPLCAALQVLNHLQDGTKDLIALDRCYLPADLLAGAGADVPDLLAPVGSPGLRRVWDTLLDRVDDLHATAGALPRTVRSRRLRLEVGVILGLSRRLAARLRRQDPVATRVKLRPADVAGAVLGAVKFV